MAARVLGSLLIAITAATAGTATAGHATATTGLPKLLFGLGTEADGALKAPLVRDAPVGMLTSWFNGTGDLSWMTGWAANLIPHQYAAGRSLHLIVYASGSTTTTTQTKYGAACGRPYPLSAQFQSDMVTLARTWAGRLGGPPLYVTLFSEFQTYACHRNAWLPDSAYWSALKDSYKAAKATFHRYAPNAKVSLGWGGWQDRTDSPATGGGRSMFAYFADVMGASDFQSFQAMQSDTNVTDILAMTKTLHAWGPVLLAHYKPDNGSQATFEADMKAMLTDSFMTLVTSAGLFGWSFMDQVNMNANPTDYALVRDGVRRYGIPPSVAPQPTPTPAPTSTPAPTPAPTSSPTPTPAPTSTPPPATAAPTPTPAPAVKSVRVTSVPALLTALADNTVDEIVVANGTYAISASSNQAPNSLWIGSRFASRTRPVTVRPDTVGGVTFDAGGGPMGGIAFNGGAHDQTWDGFRFADGTVSDTGAIMFGGYAGLNAPYNITLRDISVDHSVHRVNSGTTDHAVYFSYALDTWRGILIDRLTVDASDAMGLATAIHMDHGYASDYPNVAAHGVTVTNLTFTGNTGFAAQQAIVLWQPPVHDWLFDGATITNSGGGAFRFESIGASNIALQNITSTNSHGFYSSLGSNPPGVSFSNDSWH